MDDTSVCESCHFPWARIGGFTLIEVLVAIAVLSVLMLAVPSMSGFIARASRDAAQQDVITILSLARAEAIQRQANVTICRSTSDICAGNQINGQIQWEGGLMFVDADNNRVYDVAHDQSVSYTAFNDAVIVTWNRGDSLTFQPDGSVTGNSNGTFEMQPSDSSGNCRVVLSLQGRARQACD